MAYCPKCHNQISFCSCLKKIFLSRYNPEKNQIRFTKTCALFLTWDSIVNTLRHEMAHQLACTFPESLGQKPHGPLFKECCDLLNVDLNFTPIPVGWKCFKDRIIENQDILLRKINKLIRLVEIGNKKSRDAYIKAQSLIKELHCESTSL